MGRVEGESGAGRMAVVAEDLRLGAFDALRLHMSDCLLSLSKEHMQSLLRQPCLVFPSLRIRDILMLYVLVIQSRGSRVDCSEQD